MDAQRPAVDAQFNSTAPHDIILRSKDGVDFHVCKVILSLASPFFWEMFTLPQPTSPTIGSIETIPITEDSQTLDRLLRLCYPVPDPIFNNLTDTSDVLEAAMKYDMEEATALMRATLLKFVKDKPLEVYVVACRLKLELEAGEAAESWQAVCPKVYSIPDGSAIFPDWGNTSAAASYLPEMSAGTYFRLLRFLRGEMVPNFVNADLRHNPAMVVLHPSNYEDADITLRSLDGVYFHVHKAIISLISSDLLVNKSSEHDNLPVFDIHEDGRTLAMLLELSYPDGNPDAIALVPLDFRSAVLQTAQKYKCSKAISLLKSHFMKEIKENPLRVYFIATQCDWKEGVQEAARCLAGRSIEDVYVPEMEFSPAGVYHRLLKYCHGHRSAIVNVCLRFRHSQSTCDQLDHPLWNYNAPKWWYLDGQDASVLPAWVAAPIIAVSMHYNSYYVRDIRDARSQIHEIGKLAEEELSKIEFEIDVDQPPTSHTTG